MDDLSQLETFEERINMKRSRTTASESLWYSPKKIIVQEYQNLSDGDLNSTLEWFTNEEDRNNFIKFVNVMRKYIRDDNVDNKLETALMVKLRSIWILKYLSRGQQQQNLMESLDRPIELGSSIIEKAEYSNEKVQRRLSNRLRFKSLPRCLDSPPTITHASTTTANTTELVEAPIKKKMSTRPIEEVVDDILRLDSKYLFKGMAREQVCKYCLKTGSNLVACQGFCQSYMHASCGIQTNTLEHKNGPLFEKNLFIHKTADTLEEYKEQHNEVVIVCHDCKEIGAPFCLECAKIEDGFGDKPVRCNMVQCGRYMHETCCKYWPQAKFVKSNNIVDIFRCPAHVCHTCVSDDPKGKFFHSSQSKLTRCVKCSATYHTDSACIPAGSKILSSSWIICPRHAVTKSDQHINVNWCFICVEGGRVICCETCPIAVHDSCLKLPLNADEGYICEECESGRLPLYGELVWAKFNAFRWWPAIILPPTEIPTNVQRLTHNEHDIALRFFGTHDHAWISRRRVYLYVDGDRGEKLCQTQGTSRAKKYMIGVKEAMRIHQLMNQRKQVLHLEQRSAGVHKTKLHPQPYVKIKTNRAVPPVKFRSLNLEEVVKCECNPNAENPCGPDTNCLNRVLFHECHPKSCSAGERCQNQMFESRVSPALDVVYMKDRGFGLVCRQPIATGTFIMEYVGEVINDAEFARRLAQKEKDRDENFYFLTLEKDRVIDAGPKGNLARFMNHSCDPNCETQKWMVNCNNRVGIFAIKDIPENTELTFNYLWDDLLSKEKKSCFCGAPNCKGLIGGKSKEERNKVYKE